MKRWITAWLVAVPMVSGVALADDAGLSAKVDRLLEKQDQILRELAAIKEEVQIVKVRSTR